MTAIIVAAGRSAPHWSYTDGWGVDPGTLAAGERQLVALARAYLAAAPIAVLDEATCFADRPAPSSSSVPTSSCSPPHRSTATWSAPDGRTPVTSRTPP